MSFRSKEIYRGQRERRLRDDIYEEVLTRAYMDAHAAGVRIPWNGRINYEDWPDTIQPLLERHMAEAIDSGWFDYGADPTKMQRTCQCPWHTRDTALIASHAWGQALIRIHAQITV